MTYKLKIHNEIPLFSYQIPTKATRWGNVNKFRAHKKDMAFRPKMMKKLIRTIKRTKGIITSIRSEFSGDNWVKIITVA
ncbi:MAG: hypothetical protein M0R06_21355 [Sphaerochaeta sp.]|jgi:hypothetical protein|nr:hypothetical protein [Sphaerochaeta sp.]